MICIYEGGGHLSDGSEKTISWRLVAVILASWALLPAYFLWR
jgi:hypothetical protein